MIADEELVREWQGGSAGALEALVQRHHAPLLAHLARLTGDPHLAENLTQETAVMVGVPVGTVKSRAFTGLRRLRDLLAQSTADSIGAQGDRGHG